MLRPSPGFEESPVHESPVPSIRKTKKKLVFTSPRFSNRDEDIFVRNDNLLDSSERWESISEQAGDHRQSGRVLVLHRAISPLALRYGMTRQASLRVRTLSLALDKRGFLLAEWIDIIAVTLTNLENLSIVDSQFQDLSISKRMQRLYVLQKIPNLTSIDEISITEGERSMARSKKSAGSQVVGCDTDDDTASIDSSHQPSLDTNTFNDRSMEHDNSTKENHESQRASTFDLTPRLRRKNSECSGSKKLQSNIPRVPGHESTNVQNESLDVHTDASYTLESDAGEGNTNYSMEKALIENNRGRFDIESVTSSHIEWTATCGVLAFRSDNACVPDIRLAFCGPRTREVLDEENNSLRYRAKKGLRKKKKPLPSICTPVQRQAAGGQAVGSQQASDGSGCGAKFFPSDDTKLEIKTAPALYQQNENAPLAKYQTGRTKVIRGAVETVCRPLPLVRMHGYNDIQQPTTQHAVTLCGHDPIRNGECGNKAEPAVHKQQHVWSSSKENWANSMFDTIYDEDDDEDEIIMEARNYGNSWSSKTTVVD